MSRNRIHLDQLRRHVKIRSGFRHEPIENTKSVWATAKVLGKDTLSVAGQLASLRKIRGLASRHIRSATGYNVVGRQATFLQKMILGSAGAVNLATDILSNVSHETLKTLADPVRSLSENLSKAVNMHVLGKYIPTDYAFIENASQIREITKTLKEERGSIPSDITNELAWQDYGDYLYAVAPAWVGVQAVSDFRNRLQVDPVTGQYVSDGAVFDPATRTYVHNHAQGFANSVDRSFGDFRNRPAFGSEGDPDTVNNPFDPEPSRPAV